jgi:hypothetical protein
MKVYVAISCRKEEGHLTILGVAKSTEGCHKLIMESFRYNDTFDITGPFGDDISRLYKYPGFEEPAYLIKEYDLWR